MSETAFVRKSALIPPPGAARAGRPRRAKGGMIACAFSREPAEGVSRCWW